MEARDVCWLASSLLLLAVGPAWLAHRNPRSYRRIYPTLSRLCVAAMGVLLAANVALPALGVPSWPFFAAATLNVLLFTLLWLPRLRSMRRPPGRADADG